MELKSAIKQLETTQRDLSLNLKKNQDLNRQNYQMQNEISRIYENCQTQESFYRENIMELEQKRLIKQEDLEVQHQDLLKEMNLHRE